MFQRRGAERPGIFWRAAWWVRAKDSCVCAHERIKVWECWRGLASNPKIGQEMSGFEKAGGPVEAAKTCMSSAEASFMIPGLPDGGFGFEVTGKMPVPLWSGDGRGEIQEGGGEGGP